MLEVCKRQNARQNDYFAGVQHEASIGEPLFYQRFSSQIKSADELRRRIHAISIPHNEHQNIQNAHPYQESDNSEELLPLLTDKNDSGQKGRKPKTPTAAFGVGRCRIGYTISNKHNSAERLPQQKRPTTAALSRNRNAPTKPTSSRSTLMHHKITPVCVMKKKNKEEVEFFHLAKVQKKSSDVFLQAPKQTSNVATEYAQLEIGVTQPNFVGEQSPLIKITPLPSSTMPAKVVLPGDSTGKTLKAEKRSSFTSVAQETSRKRSSFAQTARRLKNSSSDLLDEFTP